ncbi:MAG: gamma-glutamyl-gamma-aminobutyrate hydrolase family protein [Solirubrobacterales bacterium]
MDNGSPVIGICAAVELARWTVWEQMAALAPLDYVDSVKRAGGIAVLLTPDPRVTGEPDLLLDRIDGLLVAGGSDIDPSAYGSQRDGQTGETNLERDLFEISLARRAVERDMPVLGVCRGMQVLNIAFGGTLVQHLPDRYGHEGHRPNPGSFAGSEHGVRLEEGSLAANVAGEAEPSTLQHHHQGVDEVGEGLVATGWAVEDGLTEALEMPDRRFVLGVQWHPEADPGSPVIGALVRACA